MMGVDGLSVRRMSRPAFQRLAQFSPARDARVAQLPAAHVELVLEQGRRDPRHEIGGCDKRADIHEAFLSLGCALICWHALGKRWVTG